MKRIQIITLGALALIFLVTATLAGRRNGPNSPISKSINGDGFVVLELFTSEGCSSCPPADELLAKIDREAGAKPVYVLAYHVDYWDHQGWKDIFSNAAYSSRQYQYANKLNAQVYTPQVFVNGKAEFIGSDESAMQRALISGLSGTPAVTLDLKGKQEGRAMRLTYQISQPVDSDDLIIALVQKSAVSQVKNGENIGRKLKHAQIVRSLKSFPIGKTSQGKVSIELPEDYKSEEWEIIGLLQHKKTKAIHAATKASAPQI